MGFDLYGVKAKSEKGEYFRNNVWWWRPLAKYVLRHVEVPEEVAKHWEYNDGIEVKEKLAITIADTLDKLIKDGQTARYEKGYRAWQESLPLEECDICEGTGQRDDAFVQGKCNACEGAGKRQAWATNYPFEVDNVKEFADFCRESGGFRIC